jgi:phosphoglycolate phosphatase
MTSTPAGAEQDGRMRPLEGIAFDLDGTLVNSAADIAGAVNAMLAGHGLPPQSVPYVAGFIGEGPRELLAGVYRGMGIEVDQGRLETDTATYLAHYADNPVVDSVLYHDALPALTALRERGVTLGVCTNKTQRMAEAVLRSLALDQLFEVVVGGDVLPVRKPHPDHLLEVLRRMGASPERALFVGDTAHDSDCARAAHVECVLVDWAAPRSGEAPAPRRVQRFAELVELVDERNGPVPAATA